MHLINWSSASVTISRKEVLAVCWSIYACVNTMPQSFQEWMSHHIHPTARLHNALRALFGYHVKQHVKFMTVKLGKDRTSTTCWRAVRRQGLLSTKNTAARVLNHFFPLQSGTLYSWWKLGFDPVCFLLFQNFLHLENNTILGGQIRLKWRCLAIIHSVTFHETSHTNFRHSDRETTTWSDFFNLTARAPSSHWVDHKFLSVPKYSRVTRPWGNCYCDLALDKYN